MSRAGAGRCWCSHPRAYNAWPIGMAVVAPITSANRRLRHHIPIGREAGLRQPSFVMPEYVRAISQQRLTGQSLGVALPATLEAVERWSRSSPPRPGSDRRRKPDAAAAYREAIDLAGTDP